MPKSRSEKTGIPIGKFLLAAFYDKERKREATKARRADRYNLRQESIGDRKILRARAAPTNQLKRIAKIKRCPTVNGIEQLGKWVTSPDSDPMVKVEAAEVLSRFWGT